MERRGGKPQARNLNTREMKAKENLRKGCSVQHPQGNASAFMTAVDLAVDFPVRIEVRQLCGNADIGFVSIENGVTPGLID